MKYPSIEPLESRIAPATLTITPAVAQAEGQSGETSFIFTVTLSEAPSSGDVTVDFATADGSATEPTDYVARTGTLTFTPTGGLSQTIAVRVFGDTLNEANETFSLTLSNPSGGNTLENATGTGTIQNDDTSTVSIARVVRVAENAASGAVFTVSLSNASSLPISVDYRTQDGTALAGSDYTAQPLTTLTFAPGTTSASIAVSLIGDSGNEVDETFDVLLSNAKIVGGANLGITAATGTAVILNDDRSVSIGNASRSEAAAPLEFTVALNAVSTNPVTVFYATRETAATDGTRATSSQDFLASAGSIVIPAGALTGKILVPILADTTDEFDQTFELVLTSVSNAVVDGSSVATGTILDDDAAPTVQIVPSLSVVEGATDSNAVFTVSLSQRSEKAVTVNYATTAETATAGTDFTAVTNSLTIPAGQTSRTLTVGIKGDTVVEADETFKVTLSAPTNATLGAASVSTATIVNDDVAPSLSIADVIAPENAGPFTFAVTLSRASELAVTVQFTTVDSTAAAGSDYTLTTGTLVFAPGETSKPIVVPVANNDATPERDERFLVRLSNPTNATVQDGEAIGLIQNDDVSFAIQDLTISEEGPGNAAQTALVTVTRTGTGAASVQYRTAPGSALSASGRDFTSVTGTLTFAAGGPATQTIAIPITSDLAYENDEQFTVELFSPVDGLITGAEATVTIMDNDVAPTLSAANVTFTEGTTGGALAFVVRLSAANEREAVTLKFETVDGTATSSGVFADFTAIPETTLTLQPGETSRVIALPITDDARDEPDQSFALRLKEANAAFTPGGATFEATATIVDNDAAPTLTLVSDRTIGENPASVAERSFTARLSAISEKTVRADWRTDNSATGPLATAGADYTAVAPTLLSFAPGSLEETFAVTITEDALNEGNERFDVVLANPSEATLVVGRRTATITDNDAQPTISIGDNTLVEGTAPALLFTVSLSAPSGRAVTVNYATAPGTATSSGPFADFLAQSGTLTFAPGETSKTITVPILDDAFREADAERFTVALSGPVNATIGDATGEGTVFNDTDTALGLAVVDTTVVEGAPSTTTTRQATFRVQLSGPATSTVSFTAATRNGTATAGSDYAAIGNAFSIAGPSGSAPGASFIDIPVIVTGDAIFEATESFFLDLTGFTGGAVVADFDSNGRLSARATIYNDDFQILNNGRTAQWIDGDGDLVSLTTTRGSFAGLDTATFSEGDQQRNWLQPTGTVGGRQLVLLSLLNIGGFAGASISIVAEPQPGFPGATDGLVHVGEIRAAQRVGGELDWIGLDLGTVTVEGDLGKIVAGDNVSTTALRKLDVRSLGTRGTATNGSDIASEILGPVGMVLVRGDVGGQLKLVGQEFGNIGSLTIEGALRGGSIGGTGSVIVSGRVARATIGEIIGGAGERSGTLVGNQNNNGVLGDVVVLGAVQGGAGQQSGGIVAAQIGRVKVESITGGTGVDSGLIFATVGNLAGLTVDGAITGGTGQGSGQAVANGAIGPVKIASLTGGAGELSGRIAATRGNLASLVVSGAIIGGAGDNSGQVFAGGNLGPVNVASLLAGDGDASGSIGLTKTGSADAQGNPVYSVSARVGNVSVVGSVTGGRGDFSGSIGSSISIGTTRINGDLIGGAGALSGAILSGAVGRLTIGDDLIGGAGAESGTLKIGRMGEVTVGGDIIGGAGAESGSIEGANLSSLSVGGAIVGAAGQLSGSVRLSQSASRITVGEDVSGRSIVGGAGLGAGRIQTTSSLGQIVLAGDIVGGAGDSSGGLVVGGNLDRALVRGSIIGGTSPATGAPLQSSGFLQAGLLRSAVISGDLRAGLDGGAGIVNSGTIRTGRMVSLTIEGNVIGTAIAPAIISAAAIIDASDIAIKSLLIQGNVAFAEVLAGYDGDVSQGQRGKLVSADAQISRIEVRGSVGGLNVIAGVVPGAGGRFGDATDAPGSGFGVRDSSRVISSIASVILRGSVLNTNAASFGIVAQQVIAVQTGPTLTPLAGLTRGAGNDLATAVPNASDVIATNFRAVEVPV